MKSATRTFLSLTEVEPRIVPDATATLLPYTIGTTSTTTSTTLQYADDPAHPVTTTTLGFTDDPAHSVTATPVNTTIPPTATTPPTDTAPSAVATPAVVALPPEFLAWIETLSDAEIQSLLELSDAELGALIAGTSAPESPVTPAAGLPPADTTPTLHGVDVGTSPPPPAAGPNVVNTGYQFDPNAPPPTATTLEFTNGQQQGPAVTTLQNPAQAPPITPEEALNRLQNQPQIVVVSSTPPVVQAAPPSVLLLSNPAIGIITSGGTWPGGNQMIYSQDANGTLHPYITTSMLTEMIRWGNAASSGATPGWTFGATFGEIGNLVNYAPTIITTEVMMWQLQQAVTIHTNYTNVRNNSDENQVGSAILAILGYAGAPVNDGLVHVGNQVSTIYNEQRSSGADIAGSASTTFVYSLGSVMGLVDIHEAIEGREARSGRELTSNERWSRAFLGVGSFLMSLVPLLPTGRGAAAGATAETAAGRAALEADVRASLQAAQAERRTAAISRGERQAVVPERPAGPPGEGPAPRPEPPSRVTPTTTGGYVAGKAPTQVVPGTRILQGQYVDDLGRVQPWTAYYDEFGRLRARTDFNAGNRAHGIPDTHYHTYQWGPGMNPLETGSHLPGEYVP